MRKVIRFMGLSLGLLAVVLLILDISLAWAFISSLIQPACLEPQPLSALEHPEVYWLDTADGISIRIWYYPSQNGSAIIEFGGLNGALGADTFPISVFVQHGYGIVQVDSRSCAQPKANVTVGADEILDGEAALSFLLSKDEINKNGIGAMGFSLGGATAIRLTANNPEVKAVVRDGGYSNLGEMLSPSGGELSPISAFRNTSAAIFQLRTGIDPWTISPVDDINLISPRPVFLIYGEMETAHGQIQFDSAEEPKDFWIVPGGAHGRNYQTIPTEYELRLVKFFDQYLLLNNIH